MIIIINMMMMMIRFMGCRTGVELRWKVERIKKERQEKGEEGEACLGNIALVECGEGEGVPW